jgi:hypothetical protein
MKRLDLALRVAFGIALASLPFLHYRCADGAHAVHAHVHEAKLDGEGGSP